MASFSPVKNDLKNFNNEFRDSITKQQFKQFKALKSNKKKISFVASLEKCFKYPIKADINHGKDIEEAKLMKNKGNVEFQKENYSQAFRFYSQAILKSSLNDPGAGEETVVYFANRSACLYHMKKYELAIKEIDFALKNNYPVHLSHKLLDRKARCFLAMKKHDLAIDAFRSTIKALDESKLNAEKRQKWQKDVQIMLLMLQKSQQQDKSTDTMEKSKKETKNTSNAKYEAIKADINIEYSQKMGRYARAKSDIKVGDIVLVEEPHCALLLESYGKTHCHNCFKRIEVLYPCPTCDQIMFCSEKCAEYAIPTYHQTECPILSTMWDANISVTCLMALRMITQHPIEFFLQKKNSLLTNQQSQVEEYKSSNYEAVCTLMSHENERKPEDMMNRIFMTLFLLQCLRKTSYFQKNSTEDEQLPNLNDDEIFIAQLILHHLQILQFNAHEVSELVTRNKETQSLDSKFIGGALYPTLALFNHSCNPGVVRYFKGTKVITRAIRNIRAGEMVEENYGPIFATTPRTERQQILQERYWFKCECEACTNNWPTLDELNNAYIRLRCTTTKCHGYIALDPNNDQFFIKCKLCLENNNILKALKTLQETDDIFMDAKNTMKLNPEKALKEFQRVLQSLDTTLVLPSKDYHICQEEIRICYLMMGNRS